jgi:hypothetical protein
MHRDGKRGEAIRAIVGIIFGRRHFGRSTS